MDRQLSTSFHKKKKRNQKNPQEKKQRKKQRNKQTKIPKQKMKEEGVAES